MFDSGSFRDRTARVFFHNGGVFRTLSAQALGDWQRVSREPYFQRLMADKRIVATELLTDEQLDALSLPIEASGVLKHERIPFITYPYEWSFSMLRDAALLHLEILADAIKCGTILKDSSPYNVQFCGSRPIFIDIGSFVPEGYHCRPVIGAMSTQGHRARVVPLAALRAWPVKMPSKHP